MGPVKAMPITVGSQTSPKVMQKKSQDEMGLLLSELTNETSSLLCYPVLLTTTQHTQQL